MALRYSLDRPDAADTLENAVKQVLTDGVRTADITAKGQAFVSTSAMGDAVVARLNG